MHVFECIPHAARDLIVISAMMKCCIKHQEPRQALELYHTLCSTQQPRKHDDIVNTLYLKACLAANCVERGTQLLDECWHGVNQHSIEFLNTVMDFYGENNRLHDALNLFHSLAAQHRTVITIGVIMKSCINNLQSANAISIFDRYQCAVEHGLADPVSDTLRTLYLKACINTSNHQKGQAFIEQHSASMQVRSIEFINTVIHFYGHFGELQRAQNVFDCECVARRRLDTVTINAMMTCYLHNEQSPDAMSLYEAGDYQAYMDDVSTTLYLKASVHTNNFERGCLAIHQRIEQLNQHNIELANAIMHFYGHFGDVTAAQHVFELLAEQRRNHISVSTMMKCYLNNKQPRRAIALYERCYSDIVDAEQTLQVLYLKACTNAQQYDKGIALAKHFMASIHVHSIQLINCIMDFYAQNGHLFTARSIYDSLPDCKRDIVSIGTMMNAYNESGQYHDALHVFYQHTTARNAICYSIALNACGEAVLTEPGNAIISELHEPHNRHILHDVDVQAAIIRFYAKIGDLQRASNAFDAVDQALLRADKHGVIYTAIMNCYAKYGEMEQLLSLFAAIRGGDILQVIPTEIYGIVLNGCSHCGLVQEAMNVFDELMQKHEKNGDVDVDAKHVNAVLDCLARHDELSRAEDLCTAYLNKLGWKSRLPMLLCLLAACRTHNDLARAQRVFQQIGQQCDRCSNDVVDKYRASAYVLMCNIFAQNDMFDKVQELTKQINAGETPKATNSIDAANKAC